MAKVLTVDKKRCLACKQCVTECALAHSEAADLSEAVRTGTAQARLRVKAAQPYGAPAQCRHCPKAACIPACPNKAIYREAPGSPVLVNAELCTACGKCVAACPFGAIALSRDGKSVVKCDLCIHRTAKGLEPACVAGCPTKAIAFRDRDAQRAVKAAATPAKDETH